MFITIPLTAAIPKTIFSGGEDAIQFTTASELANRITPGDRVFITGFSEYGFVDGECRFGASADFGNGTSVLSFSRITQADRDIEQRLASSNHQRG